MSIDIFDWRFPFLIGTVRTKVRRSKSKTVRRVFPFLIGTVRTDAIEKVQTYEKEFPFLIGTVRTSQPELESYKKQVCFHSS